MMMGVAEPSASGSVISSGFWRDGMSGSERSSPKMTWSSIVGDTNFRLWHFGGRPPGLPVQSPSIESGISEQFALQLVE